MTADGGIPLRVAHCKRNEECDCDHAGQIIGEPHFMPDGLEPQCDRLGRSSEQRSRDGKWQTNTRGANRGWKQFSFYYCIDRGVARNDYPCGCDQQESADRTFGCLQRMKQRNREDTSHCAEPNQKRFSADPVREGPINRLQTDRENKRCPAYQRRLVVAQTNRQPQKLLHVCCVRIEGCRASCGEPHNNQNLSWMFRESPKRAFMPFGLAGFDERICLMQAAPHLQRNDRQRCADDEWNAPAPRSHLIRCKKYLL